MKNYKSNYSNYINYINKYTVYENKKEEKKNKYTYELKVVKELELKGTYIDIFLEDREVDKNINIVLKDIKFTRIFGRVQDYEGNFVKNKGIKLYKSNISNYRTEYLLMDETITDEVGRYEFIISGRVEEAHYIVRIADKLS